MMAGMHPEFARWYAEISMDGAGRDARWEGIARFTESVTKEKTELLVRLAFNSKPPLTSARPAFDRALAAFHASFSHADAGFAPAPRQDQILAAAALAEAFRSFAHSAMAVTAAAHDGARSANLPLDLVTLAENAISLLAAERRRRPSLTDLAVAIPKIDFDVDLSAVPANSPVNLKPAFDRLCEKVGEALGAAVKGMNNSLSKLSSANRMADEELDMLLWVFGGRSLSEGTAFRDVPAARQPLVFARELAQRTRILPGPNALPALLSRAGLGASSAITVAEAADGAGDEWIDEVLAGHSPSPATTPVHFALERRRETGPGNGWSAGWSAITGIDAARALTPMKLAELFYRENLWLGGR